MHRALFFSSSTERKESKSKWMEPATVFQKQTTGIKPFLQCILNCVQIEANIDITLCQYFVFVQYVTFLRGLCLRKSEILVSRVLGS